MDHITRGYYSIKALNPTRIRPAGPAHVAKMLDPQTTSERTPRR
jgi:putative glutathione S-transferase